MVIRYSTSASAAPPVGKLVLRLSLMVLVITLSACSTCDPNRYMKTGIVLGTLVGGISGAVVASSNTVAVAAAEGSAGWYLGSEIDRFKASQGPCVEPSEEDVTETELDAVEELALEDLSVDDLTAALLGDLGGFDDEGELPIDDLAALEAGDAELLLGAESGDLTGLGEDAGDDISALLLAPLAGAAALIGGDDDLAVEDDEELVIELNRVYQARYEHGHSALPPGYRRILDAVVVAMQQHPQSKLYLSGHTDGSGTPEFNHFLSVWRAANAAVYVVEQGIEDSRVEVMGFGGTQPMSSNDTPLGRTMNRRVDILVRPLDEDGEPEGEVTSPVPSVDEDELGLDDELDESPSPIPSGQQAPMDDEEIDPALLEDPVEEFDPALLEDPVEEFDPALLEDPVEEFDPALLEDPVEEFDPALLEDPVDEFDPALLEDPVEEFDPALLEELESDL